MYLRLIDLKRVSDKVCSGVLRKMGQSIIDEFTIKRYADKIIISFKNFECLKCELYIYDTGEIHYDKGSWTQNIPNLNKIMHLLMETQWIKQDDKPPENEQEVYIKEDCGINKAIYVIENAHDSWYQLDESAVNSSEIRGWLPIENVVL